MLSLLRKTKDAEYFFTYGPENLAFNGLQKEPSQRERAICVREREEERKRGERKGLTERRKEREDKKEGSQNGREGFSDWIWNGSPYLIQWQSLSFHLLVTHEIKMGKKYDWIVYIRPDMKFKSPIPSAVILDRISRIVGTDHIWYMENNQNFGVRHFDPFSNIEI